jgi:hypothetical protein
MLNNSTTIEEFSYYGKKGASNIHVAHKNAQILIDLTF